MLLRNQIVRYLYKIGKENPLQYVPYEEILSHLQTTNDKGFSKTQFTAALKYLIGEGLIEEKAAHYQLSSSGVKYVNQLLRPKPNYARESLDEQKKGNQIGIISILVAVLIGLLTLIVTNSPKRSSPRVTPSATPYSKPLDILLATSDQNVRGTPLKNWFDKYPSNPQMEGVAFALSSDSPVIETECKDSTNPQAIYFNIKKSHIASIHLLININYGTPNWVNGQAIEGKAIGKITIINTYHPYSLDLKAGSNIREWLIGSNSTIKALDSENPIWKANDPRSGTEAVIDSYKISMPEETYNYETVSILIEDTSRGMFRSINPCIVIFGITLEFPH